MSRLCSPLVAQSCALATVLAVTACGTDARENLPPSLDAGPDLRARPHAPLALTFRVRHMPDTTGALPYAIIWGDGSTDHGVVTDLRAPVTVTHAYRAAGHLSVRVTVTTREGAAISDTLTAFVDPAGTPVVLVGAGDIATCREGAAAATALLLDSIPGTVVAVGDNAYPTGSDRDYLSCYGSTWGRHRKRTRPVPGNHDYDTRGAAAYFRYFGVAAGEPGEGYYSYELGDWHIVALNSNLAMHPGSPQEQWLRADLAAHPRRCTLAYWHHARFSSGTTHGSQPQTEPLWRALYEAGADVIVSGHEHNYERFAPQTPDGRADAAQGIREFVAGTGGGSSYRLGPPIANSETRGTDYGVLKLTLASKSYHWQFIPIAGRTFGDSGSAICH